MFEKTKLIMTLVFTLCFLSFSFLVGKFYERIHISRSVMIGVCVVMTVALAASFIADIIVSKRTREAEPRGKE
ncbi:MAG: hypothetical protein KA369_14060 [Spirochaetes bacterium]|nr:hypothetical protein [Spirochaetota bacterium]